MKDTLNPNEWIVMEALWAKSPATLGETIDRIGSRASWNYKTYQSYMNVLEKKGYISSEKRGRDKFYSPAISREECIARESRAKQDAVGFCRADDNQHGTGGRPFTQRQAGAHEHAGKDAKGGNRK